MAARISIECPACRARLSLSDSRALGRKIECPNCHKTFVAQAQGAVGTSSFGAFKVGLIIGTVLLSLITSVLGMYYAGVFEKKEVSVASTPEVEPVAQSVAPVAAPSPSASERALALRWMPAETEAVLHIKVANLAETPLLKTLFETQQVLDAVDGFQKGMGLQLTEIESINIGTSDLSRLQTLAMAQYMGFRAPAFPPKTLIVIRSTRPVSAGDLVKSLPDYESSERNGKSYLKSLNPAAPALWIPEPTTILIALSEDLHTMLDWGETSDPRQELKVVDPTPHVVLILAPKAPDEWVDSVAPQLHTDAAIEVVEMHRTLADSFTAIGVTLKVRGGFDLLTQVALESPSASNKVDAGLKSLLSDVKTQFENYKTTAPSAIAELGDLLLQNIKIEKKKQVVSLSSHVPDSAKSLLEQIPPILMLMSLPRQSEQRAKLPEVPKSKK